MSDDFPPGNSLVGPSPGSECCPILTFLLQKQTNKQTKTLQIIYQVHGPNYYLEPALKEHYQKDIKCLSGPLGNAIQVPGDTEERRVRPSQRSIHNSLGDRITSLPSWPKLWKLPIFRDCRIQLLLQVLI